jgi:uncharacterized membrane protein
MESGARDQAGHHRRAARFGRDLSELEFGRIVSFSDGVFAIAITLLVLALEVPDGVSDLGQMLKDQIPDFFAFALSFAVLAQVWFFHHRFFGSLERFDAPLISMNFLYLALVTLVPFTSELIGDYGHESIAVVIYAVNLGCLGALGAGMVRFAYRRELVNPEVAEMLDIRGSRSDWIVPATFLISIPIAFLSASAAEWSWLVLLLGGGLLARRLGRKTRAT